jgi:hypothetical protein
MTPNCSEQNIMINALRLIITKSPVAMREAIAAIRAIDAKSPMVQHRYNTVVDLALSDPQAEFTAEERSMLAENLDSATSGGNAKTVDVRVRLTADEKATVQSMAQADGMNVSDFIRSKIGL